MGKIYYIVATLLCSENMVLQLKYFHRAVTYRPLGFYSTAQSSSDIVCV